MRPPDNYEVQRAVNQTSSGKAPGPDGLPPELFKSGGPGQTDDTVYESIWSCGTVRKEFKDASIVHIFKRKGDRLVCGDHRGISLLSIPSKILARVILNRLVKHASDNDILPESQCGFRSAAVVEPWTWFYSPFRSVYAHGIWGLNISKTVEDRD